MKTFEVSYNDGNKRLLETENIIMLMKCLSNEKRSINITEIKEREEKEND